MATLTAAVKDAASTTIIQLYYMLADPTTHASQRVNIPRRI
jgi:hypothetical protein